MLQARHPAPTFAIAGADAITIHVELGRWKISFGKSVLEKNVGLAVNPLTSIDDVQPYLDKIDLLLIMMVNPGFGGQSFIEETLPKKSKPTDGNKNRVCLFVFKWMAASTKEPVVFALKKVRTHL